MIGMIPPAKGETLGRSRRTGPFQGLIDDARQPVGDGRAARGRRPAVLDLRAPWKRIVVMFAGPFMNLILAVALFAIVLMGIGVPTGTTTTVSAVSAVRGAGDRHDRHAVPAGRAADPGRRGRASGRATGSSRSTGSRFGPDDWTELQDAIRAATGTVTVTVERDGQLRRPDADARSPPSCRPSTTRRRRCRAASSASSPVTFYERQGVGAVVDQIGDIVGAHRAGDRRSCRRACRACSARCSSASSAT